LKKILNKFINSLQNEKPFVVFREPKSDILKGYFLASDEINYTSNFTEAGFVFAPFDDIFKTILFKKVDSEVVQEKITTEFLKINNDTEELLSKSIASEEYQILVKNAVNAIKNGDFLKVVTSRKESIDIKIDLLKTVSNLLSLYPNAFVYCWHHPKVGCWIGATPENLLTVSNLNFRTIALAGTKSKLTINQDWQEKEKVEHQLVIDYINNQLSSLQSVNKISDFTIGKTYTVSAGSLLHLKTEIYGILNEGDIVSLIKKLHPTPAVCGMPKEAAKKFVLDNEGYERSFYTGFLGEVNVDAKTSLFVNLRCAKIDGDNVSIYIGGGITSESNPEREWQETVAKTSTIKKAIN